MRADVAERAARARALRIDAPFGLLVAGRLGRPGQPVLRILGLNETDLAEFARPNHLAHAAHQGIAGVIMGQREDEARLLDRGLHLLRLGQAHRQRLVADDVDPGLEERVGRPGVDVVRRHDRDRLDPVGPLGLRLRHALVVVVDAIAGEAEALARAARLLGRRRQGAGDQFIMVVDARGDAMHGADERPLAAPHHPEPDPAALASVAASLDGHALLPQRSPSARSICFLSTAPPAKSSNAFSVTRMM